MPYRTLSDLPPATKAFPLHAREIFRAAFNNAWKEYAHPSKRRGKTGREETARRVAWAAVKAKYEKRGTKWTAKQS